MINNLWPSTVAHNTVVHGVSSESKKLYMQFSLLIYNLPIKIGRSFKWLTVNNGNEPILCQSCLPMQLLQLTTLRCWRYDAEHKTVDNLCIILATRQAVLFSLRPTDTGFKYFEWIILNESKSVLNIRKQSCWGYIISLWCVVD